MPRIKLNDGQEIIFQDLDKMGQATEKELMDRMGFHLAARQENCCFHNSFLVSYVSATSVSVAAGVGMQTDGTQTDPEPEKRLLFLAAAATKTLAAADGANPRIDIVSIKANRATAATDTRNFKDVDDTIGTDTFVIETDWAADTLVTTGTPAGSPAVPSTPAGYIKIAELAIAAATGLPASGGITDKRILCLPGSSRSAIVTKTAAYTATPMDEMIFADASGGAFSITLPPAAQCSGKLMRVKNKGATGTVTIDGNASELIDGAATQDLENQYSALTMLCDGTGWNILS